MNVIQLRESRPVWVRLKRSTNKLRDDAEVTGSSLQPYVCCFTIWEMWLICNQNLILKCVTHIQQCHVDLLLMFQIVKQISVFCVILQWNCCCQIINYYQNDEELFWCQIKFYKIKFSDICTYWIMRCQTLSLWTIQNKHFSFALALTWVAYLLLIRLQQIMKTCHCLKQMVDLMWANKLAFYRQRV